jgi:hypothetical protein
LFAQTLLKSVLNKLSAAFSLSLLVLLEKVIVAEIVDLLECGVEPCEAETELGMINTESVEILESIAGEGSATSTGSLQLVVVGNVDERRSTLVLELAE